MFMHSPSKKKIKNNNNKDNIVNSNEQIEIIWLW